MNTNQPALVWLQVAPGSYELQESKNVVATLHWVKPAGSHAVAMTAEGQLDLKQVSTFGPWIHVLAGESDESVATFGQCALNQPCVVTFADGDEFTWRPIWGCPNEMGFENKQGDIVVRLAPTDHALQYQAAVAIEDSGVNPIKMRLLALLGWYVLVLQHEDDLVAVTSGSAPV